MLHLQARVELEEVELLGVEDVHVLDRARRDCAALGVGLGVGSGLGCAVGARLRTVRCGAPPVAPGGGRREGAAPGRAAGSCGCGGRQLLPVRNSIRGRLRVRVAARLRDRLTVAQVAAQVDRRALHLDEDLVVGHDGWALRGREQGAGLSRVTRECWGGRAGAGAGAGARWRRRQGGGGAAGARV